MGRHSKSLSPGEVDNRIVRALAKKENAQSDRNESRKKRDS